MEYVKVLLPTVCVAGVFWYVMRAIVRGDSIERKEMERYYSQLDARKPHDAEVEVQGRRKE